MLSSIYDRARNQCKGIFQIRLAHSAIVMRLRNGVHDPPQQRADDRFPAGGARQTFGDHLALIVATLALLPRMQRHRHQRRVSRQFQDVRNPPENLLDVREHVKTAMIFEFVNQASSRAF